MSRANDPVSYARRVVVNAALDASRRPWRREVPAEILPDLSADPRSGDPAIVHAARDEVQVALAALPPRMRACVMLRYYEDLSVEQTADILDCSEGITARSVLANVGTVFVAVSADCLVYKPGSPGEAGFRSQTYVVGPDRPSLGPNLFTSGQRCDARCYGWMVEELGRVYPKVVKFRVEAKNGKTVEVPVTDGWYALI